jgi:hypothetical protein
MKKFEEHAVRGAAISGRPTLHRTASLGSEAANFLILAYIEKTRCFSGIGHMTDQAVAEWS